VPLKVSRCPWKLTVSPVPSKRWDRVPDRPATVPVKATSARKLKVPSAWNVNVIVSVSVPVKTPVSLNFWICVTMRLPPADRLEIGTGGAAGANPPVPVAGAVAKAAGASPMVANEAAASASAPLLITLMSPPSHHAAGHRWPYPYVGPDAQV